MSFLFDNFHFFLAFLTVLSALGVVFSPKPLNSALCLIATMFLLAGHFITLGAEFIGGLQVIVYAGAIMVLVVFVIMLIGTDEEADNLLVPESKFAKFYQAKLFWPVFVLSFAGIFSGLIAVTYSGIFQEYFPEKGSVVSKSQSKSQELSQKVRDQNITKKLATGKQALGNNLGSVEDFSAEFFGSHLFSLQVVGVLLFVAIISCALIASEPSRKLPAGRGLQAVRKREEESFK